MVDELGVVAGSSLSLTTGLLVASLTINWCCCQGHVWLRIVRFLGWSWNRLVLLRNGEECDDDDDRKAGDDHKTLATIDLVTDAVWAQALGWMALLLLFLSPVILTSAFTRLPASSAEATLVFYLFAVHVGRQAYLAFVALCVRPCPAKALHHTIQVGTFVAIVIPGDNNSNALLGLVGIACDIGDLHLVVQRLLKDHYYRPLGAHHTCHVANCVAGACMSLLFRGLLPVAFVALGVLHNSPLRMRNADLVVFFFYLTFTLAENVWCVLYSLLKLHETLLVRKLYLLTKTKLDGCSSSDYTCVSPPTSSIDSSSINKTKNKRQSLYKSVCVTMKDKLGSWNSWTFSSSPSPSSCCSSSSKPSLPPVLLTDLLVMCDSSSSSSSSNEQKTANAKKDNPSK